MSKFAIDSRILGALRQGIIGLVLAVGVAASLAGVCVSSADAAWGPTVVIASPGPPGGDTLPGSGDQPFVAFSPSGAWALAFQSWDGMYDGNTYLVRRPVGGAFSLPQQVAGSGSSVLEGLALTSPAAVLLFQYDDGSIGARIQSFAGGPLNASQQLVGPTEGDQSAGSAGLLTSTGGDVIATTIDDSGDAGAAVLPFGAGRFGDTSQVGGEADCGGGAGSLASAADDAGGTFVATGFGCNGVLVFYRLHGGSFGSGRRVGFKTLETLGLGAGGRGAAAVAEVYGGFRPGHVEIQVGHAGRFGRARQLATTPNVANTEVFGPLVGRTGNVLVAWEGCGSQDLGCSVGAARGNVDGRFGPSHTLALVPRRDGPNAGVQPYIGPGTIALQSCYARSSKPCSISVVFAGRGYGFTNPQRLTGNGQIDQLASDSAGDEVLVWTAANGSVWAAERTAGRGHFGPAHELAGAGTEPQPSNINAAFSEHGEALIAWQSKAGEIAATTYATNTG